VSRYFELLGCLACIVLLVLAFVLVWWFSARFPS
jgi:hypothetical protein